MSMWLQDPRRQGNFAASVKAILPITSLGTLAASGVFREFPPWISRESRRAPLTDGICEA